MMVASHDSHKADHHVTRHVFTTFFEGAIKQMPQS